MTTSTPSPLALAMEGKAPEVSISRHMVRRGVVVAPLLMAVSATFAGYRGAVSCAFAIALVLGNFMLAAGSIALTAQISLGLMMAATLFGYLIRLALIGVAVYLVRDASWVSIPSLGGTIIVTHLGLLVWEMKFVAASLAFPGLKPNAQ